MLLNTFLDEIRKTPGVKVSPGGCIFAKEGELFKTINYSIATRILGRTAMPEDLQEAFGENAELFSIACVMPETSDIYKACAERFGGEMRGIHARKLIAQAAEETSAS